MIILNNKKKKTRKSKLKHVLNKKKEMILNDKFNQKQIKYDINVINFFVKLKL